MRTQRPPRAKISAAGVSLVSQISSIAKFLRQRSSSRLVMVGTRTASLHYVFLNQFSLHCFAFFFNLDTLFSFFWYFWPRISTNLLSIHESALHGRSHDWTIALCNEHWKLLFRARDLNIIFTQNLGQDLIELIYHLIKGNPKFPTEELEANSAKVKNVSKQFPPSVTPIEGKGRKASNSR